MGIEPTSEAWEAPILPLNYARSLFLIVLRNWFSVKRSSDWQASRPALVKSAERSSAGQNFRLSRGRLRVRVPSS
jgi:hypothetical protein